MAGNQCETVEIALACLHAGWLLVPVNWHWVAPELAYVLRDAGAAAIVVGADWAPVAAEALGGFGDDGPSVRLATGPGDPPRGFGSYEAVVETGRHLEPGAESRGGVMFYTSGTTGSPKGVRGALAELGGPVEIWSLVAASIADTLRLPAVDGVQLLCGPIYHSAQFVTSIAPLLNGARDS